MKKRGKTKRSQSGIIAVVLIILLVLAGIVVVWNVVYGLIKKSSNNVQIDTMINRVDVESTKFYTTGRILVNVKSNSQENINRINIILKLKDGSSKIIEKNVTVRPMETIPVLIYSNETNLSNAQVISVSTVPIFGNQLGIEAKETTPQIDSSGNRVLELPDKLISWWKFDSDARDSVGNNHGTLYGHANIQNNALVLDGIDDYVQTPNIATKGNNESVSLWVKYSSPSASNVFFSQSWLRRLFTGTWVFVDTGNIYYSPSSEGSTDGNWHQVAYTLNATYIKTYVDGTIKSSILITNPMADETGYWWIGKLCAGSSCNNYFNGNIKNVMIFNRTLSEDEIRGIYLNQK